MTNEIWQPQKHTSAPFTDLFTNDKVVHFYNPDNSIFVKSKIIQMRVLTD